MNLDNSLPVQFWQWACGKKIDINRFGQKA
jgi:hypothetical protein